MDETKVCEEKNELMEMKLCDKWDRNPNVDNFFELNEITVTITLSEYRRLVSENAAFTEKVSRYANEKYSLQNKVETLEKELKELKGE